MEITKNQVEKIEKFVEAKLDSLNWEHTQEVRKIAQKLARLEKADKEIIDVAVLFHDIGKYKGDDGHVQRSADITRKFLEREGLNQRFVEEVVYCVIAHELPWKNQSNLINTTEAKVVFDADIIQQLSEFGIIKHTLAYQEIIKKDFREGMIKSRDQLFKAYNLLLTKNGQKLAEEGYKFVKEFYQKLL